MGPIKIFGFGKMCSRRGHVQWVGSDTASRQMHFDDIVQQSD